MIKRFLNSGWIICVLNSNILFNTFARMCVCVLKFNDRRSGFLQKHDGVGKVFVFGMLGMVDLKTDT